MRPAHYQDIYLPKNTGVGFIVGAVAFVFGFAMIWHIWWLAIIAGLLIALAIIVRSFNDDNEYCLSAAEIERIEDRHYKQAADNDLLNLPGALHHA